MLCTIFLDFKFYVKRFYRENGVPQAFAEFDWLVASGTVFSSVRLRVVITTTHFLNSSRYHLFRKIQHQPGGMPMIKYNLKLGQAQYYKRYYVAAI